MLRPTLGTLVCLLASLTLAFAKSKSSESSESALAGGFLTPGQNGHGVRVSPSEYSTGARGGSDKAAAERLLQRESKLVQAGMSSRATKADGANQKYILGGKVSMTHRTCQPFC